MSTSAARGAPEPSASVGSGTAQEEEADSTTVLERFQNTRWSILLALDEGGRTMFTATLLPDGAVHFGNGRVEGRWRVRKGYMVIKAPEFLFGNDLYYSGRIDLDVKDIAAGETEPSVVRLREGVVDTEQSRKVVRIGTFSAHQIVELAPDDDDASDDDDSDEPTDLSRILD